MKKWQKAMVYTVVTLFGLSVVLVGLVFATIDPYSFEDMSRGAICERSGGYVAPECTMPPESAEKVLAALLACDAQFFKVLDAEKAVFNRADIVAHPYNLLDTGEPRTSVVTFSKPVEAYGLHLTGYAQRAAPGKSDYAWGFYASEQSEDVERVLETARNDALAAKPRASAFVITASDNPDFPGTRLGCRVAGAGSSGVEASPSVYDLFLSRDISTALSDKFDLFVASAMKTVSEFGR
ncbi:hypothetical protein PWG15_09800 [Ensifer adhaerens]|uniref:hypothetical protein n=1 Tax=Ensifer adhaerens TaxID=106592 RepID=UPI0023A9EFED|nr:hypothetical protein [Ensifer adhaerens]WDZ78756.1 hypothetical protein PWG15_09800 [Ensifer adhaerens]